MKKYHVQIRDKKNKKVLWRFTDKSVSKEEADKIVKNNTEQLNHMICYLSIEEE